MRLLFVLLLASSAALADMRMCHDIQRDADGRISRSAAVVDAFQREHPCPSTGKASGPCKGWAVDHVIPLACGGCDSLENMQWLKNTIKSCKGRECKDRWERKVYCSPQEIIK